MSTQDKEVAATILQQLGGRRFMAMTGIKKFVAAPQALGFHIGMRTANRANKCRITLTAADDYTMEFFRYTVRTGEVETIETHEGLFWDQLQDMFTQATGLATHL